MSSEKDIERETKTKKSHPLFILRKKRKEDKEIAVGARKMAQQLREFAVLTEDPSSVLAPTSEGSQPFQFQGYGILF